jgi:hypothetical protein
VSETKTTEKPIIDPAIRELANEARRSQLPNPDVTRARQLGRSILKSPSNFDRFGAIQQVTHPKTERRPSSDEVRTRQLKNQAQNFRTEIPGEND